MKKLCYLLFGIFSLSFTNYPHLAHAQNTFNLGNISLPAGQTKLLRFPAIYKNQVVFVYGGDLYTANRSGGVARRLTNHVGYEAFPRFSPDGTHIAFTGQYDGNTEVYVIPATGGAPKRLTYTATLSRDDIADRMGPNNIVLTWRDNQSVIYRSRRYTFNDFKGQLFVAHLDGSPSDEIPFSVGGFCSYAPDQKKLAYNRIFREFRTWKYYKGGMADDIYIHDFAKKEAINITNNDAQDIMPMWHGNKVYYISDRDRTMNLFCYDINTRQTRKVTQFTDYDIKFPSLGDDAIIFEKGGQLFTFNINTEEITAIEIRIEDDLSAPRIETEDASKIIHRYDISPDGKRILFGARGDVYSVPATSGVTRNHNKTSECHERNPTWSPDGRHIAYISDKTGEDEIYIENADGSGNVRQLTTNGDNYKYSLVWSPDGKKILWADKKLRLRYVDIDTRQITEVDLAESWEFYSYSWSPDSKWIVYSHPEWQSKTRIYVYGLESRKKQAITEEWYSSDGPVFSPDGKYIFFVSERDFNPVYSATEWNTAYQDMDKVYFVTLQKSTPNPLNPASEEVKPTEESTNKKDKDEKNKEDKKDPKSVNVTIDFDGIIQRTVALPVEASNYYSVDVKGNKVYYLERNHGDDKTNFKSYDLESRKETYFGNIDRYQLATKEDKIMVARDGKYYITDIPKGKLELEKEVDLSGMKVRIDKAAEWKQIYYEGWRQMRDFFYDPNLHGVDWKQIGQKYGALLPYVRHRSDLTYLMGEMIGELNCGHAYANNGDAPKPQRVPLGLLGAKVSKDPSGFYKIEKILKGANWDANLRSPLTEIGVDVKQGDFIVAINGVPTNSVKDMNSLLIETANKSTELQVNAAPNLNGARKVVIKPLSSEADLRYYNWVEDNIRKVSEATNGTVGYVHIPDMVSEGLNEFVKRFYPQLNKKALIVDVRGNGGGNVSPMIIERLRRNLDMVLMSRNTKPTTSPAQMMIGPIVAMLDQYTASDGDLFSYRFKYNKIGTLIGVRSWGGTVGIRGSLPFVDGGGMTRPEFSRFDVAGQEWIIEGKGINPDIEVINDPAQEYEGIDAQLNTALDIIKKQMQNSRTELPPVPQFPRR